MIFLILNIILFISMIFVSFTIDRRNRIDRSSAELVNLILFLAALSGFMAVTVILCYKAPYQLSRMAGRLTFFLMAWYIIYVCKYILAYPAKQTSTPLTVVQWILNVFAFYIIFLSPKGRSIYGVNLDTQGNVLILSGPVFNRALTDYTKMSWFQFYNIFYGIVVPFFTFIMALVKAENQKDFIYRQRMVINSFSILVTWITFAFLMFANKFQGKTMFIAIFAFIPQIAILISAYNNDEVFNRRSIIRYLVRVLLRYIIPAVIIGLVFSLFLNVFKRYSVIFALLYILIVFVVSVVGNFLTKKLANRGILRDGRYAEGFEKEITSLDFDEAPDKITNQVFQIFHKYVDTSSMKILINGGEGLLETIYTSNGEMTTIPIDDSVCDTLLNIKHQILFREYILTSNSVSSIKSALLKLLDDANSDAFILLNEGRQIIGAIFLGKKETNLAYSEYDYQVFNKLYSNFFVVGYFVKNIMNENVVGTVNREIRMSGQIITSIQENMDLIKNPKVDASYMMVPAHNIGGEFVDMIRLTDTRHIFVIGALSGKGIAASMNMVILKSIIRTFLAETTDFKLLVEKVNSFIRESLPKGTYFAGTFGLIDFNTDTLYYINCGTPALFLYTRAYNNVIEIQGEGRILGFAKDIKNLIRVKKVKLAEGDIVASCTDGLIETRSLRGEQFGRQRIQQTLMENTTFPASKMSKFLYDGLSAFTSKSIEDDVTILVIKYQGAK